VSPLRLTGGSRDDACMPSARATALAIAAVAAVALSVVTVAQGCGGRHVLPVAVPSDVHLAEAAASGEPPSAWPAGAAYGATRLEAVRTVALYCRLVDAGQFARAGELCTARRLWSRRAFRAVSRFRFRSARVFAAPDARTLVLKARVRVHARPGRPLPDGLAILFFTLGRAGSAVGGWLITAVSTDP
jgi:hypothetical protein